MSMVRIYIFRKTMCTSKWVLPCLHPWEYMLSNKAARTHLLGEFSLLELHLDPVFKPQKKTRLFQLECILFPFTKSSFSYLDRWLFHWTPNDFWMVPDIIFAFKNSLSGLKVWTDVPRVLKAIPRKMPPSFLRVMASPQPWPDSWKHDRAGKTLQLAQPRRVLSL